MDAALWKRLLLVLCALSSARPALAQATGPSTEILADNRVAFRLYAPDATDVRLTGNWPDTAKVP